MAISIDLDAAQGWLLNQVNKHQPQYLALVGNRAFALRPKLQETLKDFPTVRVVHLNAFNYIKPEPSTVLLLADETELGREIYEAYTTLSGFPIKKLFLRSLFLNQSPLVRRERRKAIDFLISRTEEDKVFADALSQIEAWKSFEDDVEFHSKGIVAFTDFMRSQMKSPLNSDATLFRMKLRRGAASDQFFTELSKFGTYIESAWSKGA